MAWLCILAILAVLFIVLCLTRIGMHVTIGSVVTADITLGFFRIRVAPSPKGEKEEKVKTAEKKPKDLKKTIKKIHRPSIEDIKTAYQLLWPPAKRAFKRFGQGIRIHPFTLAITIPGRNDPAAAAETYGGACAVIWTIMPAMEEIINIPKPSLHIGVDYDAEKTVVQGQIGVSIRIGTLIAIGFGMIIPTIRWIIKFQKAHKRLENEPQKHTDSTIAA